MERPPAEGEHVREVRGVLLRGGGLLMREDDEAQRIRQVLG
jgi:hypothetical protein